jgi:hypothetical protein
MAAFNKNKIPLSAHYAMMSKQNKKLTDKNRYCLLGETNCRGKAIKSHSIQEASLRKISDSSSHVYHFASPDFGETQEIYNKGIYFPKKISVSNATVFNGFCIKHDTELFRCIEKEKIEPNVKQLNALHFRAASRAFQGNCGLKEAIINIRNYDYPEQHKPQKELAHVAEQDQNLEYVLLQMLSENNSLVNNLSGAISNMDKYLFLRLKCIPDLMCSTLLAPLFGFKGESLMNKEIPKDIQHLCVTISSDEVGGYIALQWSSLDYISCSFIKSFTECRHNFNRLVAYLMIFTDVVFSPNWWSSLSKEKQEAIMHFAIAPHFTQLLRDIYVSLKIYNNFIKNETSLVCWEIVQYKSNA